jgi:2-polyprenyl-6-methoxyphenol hydroxylase-like FAD-dependent oxidoreductase
VERPHWLIAGAGIGGLTLGAALSKAGHSFTIFDQQQGPTALGAGIAMAPNAMNALSTLDLADSVRQSGEVIRTTRLLSDKGRSLLTEIDLGFLERQYGCLPVAIHRKALLTALLARAGESNVKYGYRLIGTDQSPTSITAQFENGEQSAGSALIGADGIHSQVARSVVGQQALNYQGFVAWRAIAPNRNQLVARGTTTQIWGPGTVFGVAPVNEESIYWYGTCLAPADFAGQATREDALKHFADWEAPVAEIIRSTPVESILCHAIYDHDTLASWCKGRIALLGDAAHAMPPNLGQGGAQAILDAVSLANQIDRNPDFQSAFAAYEKDRLQSANSMVEKSRRAARTDHLSNPLFSFGRDMVIKLTPTFLLEKLLRPPAHN